MLHGKRVIAKARPSRPSPLRSPRKPSRRKPADLLCALPADVSALIIDLLREDDLRRVPLVSPAWAALFAPHSPLEPALRALVARRFGLHHRPPHAAHLSWGQLYLALRRERCHLCPAPDVAPFVYAGSSSLALVLQCHLGHPGLALFPVCTACFGKLLHRPGDPFVPVVETSALGFLSPEVENGDLQPQTGFLYSDIPGCTQGSTADWDKGVQYVLGHPLADLSPRFRRRFTTQPAPTEPTVILE